MPEWAFQLLTAGTMAAATYAAMRADLARLHERTMAHGERLAQLEQKVFR